METTSLATPPQKSNNFPIVCSNCCEPLFHPSTSTPNSTPDFLSMSSPVYELSQNSEPIKVSRVLERIFRLALLRHAPDANAKLMSDTPLCPTCANILDRTDLLLQEFHNLRRFDSYLSSKLTQLEEIIQDKIISHKPEKNLDENSEIVEIKSEPPDFEDSQGEEPETIISEPSWVASEGFYPSSPTSTEIGTVPEEGQGAVRVTRGKRQAPKRYYQSSDSEQEDITYEVVENSSKRRKQSLQTRNFKEKSPKKQNREAGKKKEKTETNSETNKTEEEGANFRRPGRPKAGEVREPRKRVRKCEALHRRKMLHPFPCVYCELDFDVESDRVEHLKETHANSFKSIICPKCGKLFANEYVKKYHEPRCDRIPSQYHLPPFICKDCGKEYESYHSLRGHIRQVHNEERPHACDQCDFRAKAPSVLNTHKKSVHSVSNKVQCPQCPTMVKSEEALAMHTKRMHTPEGFAKYQELAQKYYEKLRQETQMKLANQTTYCEECKIDFFTVRRLVKHRHDAHDTGTKWQCEQCGKRLTAKKGLIEHIRFVHTDERPFVCDQCGDKFKHQNHLRNHKERLHTEGGKEKWSAYQKINYNRRKQLAIELSKFGKPAEETSDDGDDDSESE